MVGWLAQRQALSAAGLLVLALHLCFFPFIWGNRTLLAGSRGLPSVMPGGALYGGSEGPAFYRGNDMGASAWVMEPFGPLVRHQYLTERKLPLWNPYQAYGMPLAANMQSQPFYPLYTLFALNPGPRTYNLFILCRLLIAGLGAYLYLKMFLPFAPSLAGGLVFMLSGYNILFFDMPHLSVDVLLPALLLSVERLLRQQDTRNVVLAVAVIFLAIAGGMPESLFLLLTFGSVYFLFRVVSDPAIRSKAGRQIAYFTAVNLLGFALAAFLLAPFLEFLRLSFNAHQFKNLGHISGLEHDRFGLSILTYLVPMLFGTAWRPIAPGLGGYTVLRGFFGILPAMFGIIALGGLSVNVGRRFSTEHRLLAFFAGSAIVVLLKRYGSPLVDWIGYLPLFQFVQFPKYGEAILAFAVSVLCAFGVRQVLAQQVSRRRLAVSLSIAFLGLAGIAALSLPAVSAAGGNAHQCRLSLEREAAVLLVAAPLLLASLPQKRGTPKAQWMDGWLLALLACELACSYIFPVYYLMTRSATDAASPYRGSPYIDFLKANLGENERVFGSDMILYPNWAGAFQIADIRDLDAMYYSKYLPFVRFFLRDEARHTPGGDLAERFTGGSGNKFDTPLKKRLLQISSVKYLLSGAGRAARDDLDLSEGAIAHTAFRQVYDREIKICENLDYLPRAALFSSVEVVPDENAELASLGSLALDIFQTAVVSSTALGPADTAALRRLNSLPPERVRAARILSYTSQDVRIDAAVERPALLVLNDSDYPGWEVSVDGRRSHWFTTNYLFRGVLLDPGKHLVRFTYKPASFAAGAAISTAGFACLAGFVAWRRLRAHLRVPKTRIV